MLFDSPEMERLRKKYLNESIFHVPEVIVLDRADWFQGERDYLDQLVLSTSSSIQHKWISAFTVPDNGQHLGVWFEIMLYGWLQSIGEVVVEPEIENNLPDFALMLHSQQIFIEAKFFTISEEERTKENRRNELFKLLDGLERKYIIQIIEYKIGGVLALGEIKARVLQWLDNIADDNFQYKDKVGNQITLKAIYTPSLNKVGVVKSESLWINPQPLKKPLSSKASQHKKMRKANHPYVIAIFVEPQIYSAEEVVSAWFGTTKLIFDSDQQKIVEQTVDKSGLHFWGKEIRHTSVSGTLIFKSRLDKEKKRRILDAWFVENPYANTSINYSSLPVLAWFAVQERDHNRIKMDWIKNNSYELI